MTEKTHSSSNNYAGRWKDFPHYILDITWEIWEGRGVRTLHEYYADDIPVRSPAGLVVGNQNVISATLATIAEFPDRELLGQDVIWSVQDNGHHLSSHRILSTATHDGDGAFGAATGTKLKYLVLADCAARGQTIDDEWLIRDLGAIVRQLGWDPKDYAADMIEKEGGVDKASAPFSPTIDEPGPYDGKGNTDPWGVAYAAILQRIMAGDLSVVKSHYDRACETHYAGGLQESGWGAADRFWSALRSAFPNARFTIEHQIGREDRFMPPRAAIRWSLEGKHEGWGAFGEPTGADVYVMGISHVEFGPFWGDGDTAPKASIRREWALYDEVAIWKQILMRTRRTA